MLDDLARFASLYVRPRRAFSGIIDDGSLVFALAVAVGGSALVGVGPIARELAAERSPAPAAPLSTVPPSAASAAPGAGPEGGGDEPSAETVAAAVRDPRSWAHSAFAASAGLWSVVGLALVYAPFVLLLATLVAPVGSFGVAFRRDFGPLLACLLNAWGAASLPVGVVSLVTTPLQALAAWALGAVGFTVLAAVALRVALGLRGVPAGLVAVLGWVAFVFQPCLGFLASPFLLFLAWHALRGDVGDVLWSFRARQSFRRWLRASTLNPRDADAHYQLGLIHLQRGQRDEAMERFRRAVEIDPSELDAHYQLGRMARADGRHADALRHFEAVLARDDAFARHEVWREAGSTYLEAGSLAEARWALGRYVDRRSHDPEGLFLLGSAAQRLGEGEAARDAYARCVEAVETTPGFRRREVGRWARQARQQLAQLGK